MTVGERIRARRKELCISADHLAEAIGISRSTMYRYENGDIEKVPGDVLGPISAALHTTPSYLMGWDDEECGSAAPILTGEFPPEDESRLLSLYRDLNPEGQEKLLDYADDLVSSGKYIKNNSSDLGKKQA